MASRSETKHMPYPEIVERRRVKRPYAITSTPKNVPGGHTDKVNRHMVVPLAEIGKMISRHEMAHVIWSPRKFPKVRYSDEIIQCIEDARVQLGLEAIGVPIHMPTEVDIVIAALLDRLIGAEKYDEAVLRIISATGSSCESRMRRRIRELPYPWNVKADTWVRHIQNALVSGAKKRKGPVARFSLVRKLGLQLSKEIDNIEEEDKKTREARHDRGTEPDLPPKKRLEREAFAPVPAEAGSPKPPMPPARPLPAPMTPVKKKIEPVAPFKGIFTEWDTDTMEEALHLRAPIMMDEPSRVPAISSTLGKLESSRILERIKGYDEVRAERGKPEVVSGEMSIIRPPLVVLQPRVAMKNSPKPTCAPEGTMIRRPDRLCIDRAIFARKSRGGSGASIDSGCTILIDNSGSMSLHRDDIEKMTIEAGGYATVAIYSGKGREGELVIVAKDAHRAKKDDLKSMGIGNIIDEHALNWLAAQAAPRIWISDGGVTGVGDRLTIGITNKCKLIASTNQIHRSDSVTEGLAWIQEHYDARVRTGAVETGPAA